MRAARALLLVCCIGCVHWYASEARRVREGLVGLQGRDLRSCLPVPDIEVRGEGEDLTYSWIPPGEEDLLGKQVVAPPGPSRARGGWPAPRSAAEPPRRPFCELTLSLRDGVVREVRSRGRDHLGLNLDADCLIQVRHCLPREVTRTRAAL